MTPTPDEFYVGYLPMPAEHGRFTRRLVAGLVVAGVLVLSMWAASQRSPGVGRWGTQPVTIQGWLVHSAYPMVIVDSGADADGDPGATSSSVLLVEQGKHGAEGRARPLAGQRVVATGLLIERGATRMLELLPGDAALVARPAGEPQPPAYHDDPADGGVVTLEGEIVDAKCYLGAMRPGDGLTHRACAALCVQGGVPCGLVVTGASGDEVFVLLENPTGGAPIDAVIDRMGVPVSVTGRVGRVGGALILRLEGPDAVARRPAGLEELRRLACGVGDAPRENRGAGGRSRLAER